MSLGGRLSALDPGLHRKTRPAKPAAPMTWQRRMTLYLTGRAKLTPAQERRCKHKRGRVG